MTSSSNSPERGIPIAQTIVLIVLFAAPAIFCLRAACVADPDVWWHMRSAEWILQHHSVPYTDPFSSTEAGKPWAAYSWLFELLVLRVYHAFGVSGLLGYTCAMVLAITVALHRMIRRLQPDFTFAALLTYAVCYSLGRLFTPRPWLFTVLLFVLELDLLLCARRSGRWRPLLWLPVLFALWANLHIQFIDGLIVLGFALAESVYTWFVGRRNAAEHVTPQPALHPLALGAVLLASLAAVCLNPYGVHIYQVAYELATQPGVLDKIAELQALPFRSLADFAILFFALGAAAVLASNRKVKVFEALLFCFALYVSFRSQRDSWVLAIAAGTILGYGVKGSTEARDRTPLLAVPLAIALACAVVLAGFPIFKINNRTLAEKELEPNLPVRAVEAIERQHLTGPLYNGYDWGGYLMWTLRQPVSIDGRANLHGTDRLLRSMDTIFAQPDWATDPELLRARLIVLPVKSPLTQVLRLDAHFRLAYEDKLATVFVAQSSPAAAQGQRAQRDPAKPTLLSSVAGPTAPTSR